MVALSRQRLSVPLAPLIAGILAIFVALVVALLPADMLGNLVLASGIAALVPAAEPPLGATARAALILIGGGGIGLIAWFAAFLLVGTRSVVMSGRGIATDTVPVLRRADAHPDAPPRRPLFATQDLGTPFLDVRAPVHPVADEDAAVGRDLPADLDSPMSAYDPEAIPAEPSDVVQIPAPLPLPRSHGFDDGERFQPIILTPIVAPAAADPAVDEEPAPILAAETPRAAVDASVSIAALLDRLEKGVTGRTPLTVAPSTAREESLQESLASLRRMAINP